MTNKEIFVNLLRNLKSGRSLLPGPFVFDNFVHKKGLGFKEKIKLTFLKVCDNPLAKYFSFKRIYYMQWLFRVVYQYKKGVWD